MLGTSIICRDALAIEEFQDLSHVEELYDFVVIRVVLNPLGRSFRNSNVSLPDGSFLMKAKEVRLFWEYLFDGDQRKAD